MPFKIYRGETVIAEGESPLTIRGVAPNTTVAAGEYQAVRVEDGKESVRVDIPAFTMLPIAVTGVTLSPKTSTAEAGTAGSRQLTATIEPTNATNKGVTYSISPTTGLTVSNSGLIEWTEDVPAGQYTTTVTTDDGGKTDTHTLTLTEPPEPDPED
ncbi:putative Ig domain-containing protein [Halalkalibacterium halodurans]|uniref:putative Ig domain-containing protein n=1 Tax=Halalkalibacterium halodurans TaxID=86665 RepID=UPI0010FDD613|nr:putative Ig domain-containing protein [Halalkalibacterium halodurans]